MKNESCIISDVLDCDGLYQELKDRKFVQVLKNGYTQDIDNWRCPKCNSLNITQIIADK